MMRQSLQAVLPENSGNKTSSLRKSVCSDLLTLLILLIRHYRHYLFQACPSGNCITRATNIFRAGIAVSCVLHCYFMVRIAALQVNLKEAYCHTLAISLEIMLYHDDEPLTFDLVWDNGGWRSATLENVS